MRKVSLEINLKCFSSGLPAWRSDPPGMRHIGLRKREVHSNFPLLRGFWLRNTHLHGYLCSWGLLGKKGLVSCLSSSQRDLNVLWFELSLALGKKQSRAFGGRCCVGFIRALTCLQKCNSFSDQMVPNWCVSCFPGELFTPQIKGPKKVCAHWFTRSWFAHLCACLSAWVFGLKTQRQLSLREAGCVSEPNV